MIIGFAGKMQVGKDLSARIIQYLTTKRTYGKSFLEWENEQHRWYAGYSNWKIVKFADKLKDILCILIGCTREQLENSEFKEKELGEEWWIKTVTYIDGGKHTIINPTPSEELDLKSKYPISYNISITKPTPRMLLQQIGTDLFRNQLHPNTWVNATMSEYDPKEPTNNYPYWVISDVRFPNEAKAIKERGGILIKLIRDDAPISDHSSETSLDNYTDFNYIIKNNSTIDDLIDQINNILKIEDIL